MLCDFQIEDSWTDYSSKRDHVGGADLNLVLRSPKHFQQSLLLPVAVPDLILSALKCYIFKGVDSFLNAFVAMERRNLPEPDKRLDTLRNNAFKKSKANDAKTQGKRLLFPDQFEMLQEMIKSFRGNVKAMALLHDCKYRETSFYSDLDVDGYKVKAKVRCDAISDKGYYVNVITSSDGSPSAFFDEAYKLGMHVSEAFNFSVLNKCLPDALAIKTGYIVVVETVAPYLTQVYEFDMNSYFLARGAELALLALNRIKTSAESGNYKGYDIESNNADGVMQMGLPDAVAINY